MIKKVTVSHLYFRPVPTKNHSRSRKYQPPDTSPKRGCNRLEASTMFQMNMPMITPMSRRENRIMLHRFFHKALPVIPRLHESRFIRTFPRQQVKTLPSGLPVFPVNQFRRKGK